MAGFSYAPSTPTWTNGLDNKSVPGAATGWSDWNPAADLAKMGSSQGNQTQLTGAWGVEAAPTSHSQMYPAQMSAPQAAGRPSNQDINAYWQANQGNPQAIVNAANQYGLSQADILGATGGTMDQWNAYTGQHGITQGPGGFQMGGGAGGLGGMAGAGASGGMGSGLGGWGGIAGYPGIANDPNGGGGMNSNPYMSGQVDFLKKQMGDFTQRNLAGIRSNFVGAGGLGGSRQGIAEGQAIADGQNNFGGQVANMLSGNYMADRNLNTQSYNTNRALDLQQYGLGAQMLNQSQQIPWTPLQNASGIYSPYTGLGGQDSGSNWQQIVGGLLSGAGLAGRMGLWS